jgi:serine/threonine protein kinase
LKPGNILFDDDFRVKIGDFGSSRLYEIDVLQTLMVGTSLYMAPEVYGGEYGPKVDVYSFGLILYEIVVGNCLFSCEGGNKGKLYDDLRKGWRPAIPSEVKEVSRRLIERCWSENPEIRPSFSEIWGELEKSNFEVVEGVDSGEVISFARTERRKRIGK